MKKLIFILLIINLGCTSSSDQQFINRFIARVESNIYSLPFEKEIDFDEEIKKIKEDLDYQKGFLKSVNSKLENKRFTDNAPDSIVQNEIKKKNDAISKISVLEERLKKLEG